MTDSEQSRWHTIHTAPPVSVVVAGIKGGVGTTTICALLVDALVEATHVSPHITDHSGGILHSRTSHPSTSDTSSYYVHDLGPHATTNTPILVDVGTTPVIVADCLVPSGLILDVFENLYRNGKRAIIVATSTAANRDVNEAARQIRSRSTAIPQVAFGYDPVLATPGPVAFRLCHLATQRAAHQLTAMITGQV